MGQGGADTFEVDLAPDAGSVLAGVAPEVRRARAIGSKAAKTEAAATGAIAALRVMTGVPPHPRLDALARLELGDIARPLGRIGAHGAEWILCPVPNGRPLSALGACDAATVAGRILRPAASALARLNEAGLTHRAINPLNLFLGESGLALGPFWLAPPAYRQHAVFEPPDSAACGREGRGPGTIADDVYALGVTLIACLRGAPPMEGLSEQEIVERKLWQGSAAALIGDMVLPPMLDALILAMVADDPRHRPRPERLAGQAGFSAPLLNKRRVNAALPLRIGDRDVWTAAQLAYLIGHDPNGVADAAELGRIDQWLRHGLNEVVLAERVEQLVRPAGGGARDTSGRTLMLARLCRFLDPVAPMTWNRTRLKPDGLPGLLAERATRPCDTTDDGSAPATIATMLASGLLDQENVPRPFLPIRGPSSLDLTRLAYEANPSMACASPLLAGAPVVAPEQLLPALEHAAATGRLEEGRNVDHQIAAFIGARQRRIALRHAPPADQVAAFDLLASLAALSPPAALPCLALRMSSFILEGLAGWPGRSAREARRAAIMRVVGKGDLPQLRALEADRKALSLDLSRQADAHLRVAQLRDALAALGNAATRRDAIARRFGRETVAVVASCAASLILLLRFVT